MPAVNFLASQYVSHQMLLTHDELIEVLPDGFYAVLGAVVNKAFMTKDQAANYMLLNEQFKIGMAFSKSHFEVLEIGKGFIVSVKKPVIEIKPFSFTISSENVLLEDVFVKGSIKFGLSFSYPRLFSREGEIIKTRGAFVEAKFFDGLRGFKREMTVPARIQSYGVKCKTGARIGKKAFRSAKEKIKGVKGLELRGLDD